MSYSYITILCTCQCTSHMWINNEEKQCCALMGIKIWEIWEWVRLSFHVVLVDSVPEFTYLRVFPWTSWIVDSTVLSPLSSIFGACFHCLYVSESSRQNFTFEIVNMQLCLSNKCDKSLV